MWVRAVHVWALTGNSNSRAAIRIQLQMHAHGHAQGAFLMRGSCTAAVYFQSAMPDNPSHSDPELGQGLELLLLSDLHYT